MERHLAAHSRCRRLDALGCNYLVLHHQPEESNTLCRRYLWMRYHLQQGVALSRILRHDYSRIVLVPCVRGR